MGMDVMGVNPVSDTGAYFRRSVWGWHPLWTYIEDMHPALADKVGFGHSNDGDGLDANDSRELAKRLMTDVETGRASSYIEQRNATLADLPMEPCQFCDSTGVRTDDVGVRMGMDTRGWCNGCDGKGEREPWQRSYSLDKQDLLDFAVFLQDCGGFEIW